ncbi:MAG: aminopeptidase P family protein [Candidatus Zixiibacteriota bacterium]|nr:MAG: aminopeptidase P family protein [candidate division Zixibacteria bacterium]
MRIITDQKLSALTADLASRGADVLLISDFESNRNKNLRYVSGHPSDAHLLLFQDGSMTLIPWDQVMARQMAQVDVVLDIANFDRSYRAAVSSALRQKLGDRFTLEVLPNEKHFTVLDLQDEFPQAKFICRPDGADAGLIRARSTKTPQEIAILREGARVTDDIINLIRPFVEEHRGLKEIDLAIYLEVEMRRRGAEGVSFETLTANRDRSGMIHQVPPTSDAQLDLPGLALIDMGLWWKGYATDVTVPLIFGQLPPEQQAIVDATQRAYDKAISLIKPGALAHEIADAAITVIEQAGLNMPYSLGHGIGLEVHDPPFLRRKPTDPNMLKYWKPIVLEPGMVFTVEPGVVHTTLGGCRLENDVVVTGSGVEEITHSHVIQFK